MRNETTQLNTDSYRAHILLCKERKIHSDSMTIHLISVIDILWLSRQSTITEKMAACTFSQDALPMSIENYGINMTQDHLMRNFRLYRYVTRTNVSFFDPSPNDERTEYSCA